LLNLIKDLLKTEAFLGLFQDWLLSLLKMQAMGGFRGWLLKTLVKEFSEEVIDIATDVIDYIEIKKKIKGTINEEDRNTATDKLNDIMR